MRASRLQVESICFNNAKQKKWTQRYKPCNSCLRCSTNSCASERVSLCDDIFSNRMGKNRTVKTNSNLLGGTAGNVSARCGNALSN
jgi:hypothetical protein